MTVTLPAWSEAFAADARAGLAREGPFGRLDREAVFGDADGAGVVVAIVDSGVDADHPGVGGRVTRRMRVDIDGEDAAVVDDPQAPISSGTGPRAPGSSPASRPAAELVSIRVLGADNRGKGRAVAAAVEWAIEQRIGVVNLSLSSRSEAMFSVFHELADQAYFANVLLVCAANNVPGPVVPVALRRRRVGRGARHPRSGRLVLQPLATRGVRCLRCRRGRAVARWRADPGDGQLVRGAALAAQAARLRSRYPAATPFEIKALLAATASTPRLNRNDRPEPGGRFDVGAATDRYWRRFPLTSSSSSSVGMLPRHVRCRGR